MASEIIAVVSCIAEFTVAPLVKQVQYVFNYNRNLTNLPREVQKLRDLKLEIDGLVSSAQRNAEEIKPSVEAWMKEADHTAVAAHRMIQEDEQSRKRCFMGLCPNPVSRYRSSRNAFKKTMQIVQVHEAGRELKEGSVSFRVSAVPSFPLTVTLGKDFLDFNSRSKTWEEIMEALKDPSANVIGVYGMGGLGKTTLVNQVAARAVEEKLFDEVVVPVVTQKNVRDANEFQEEMAKALNMKLDDQWNQWNVSQRADRIFKRLTQKTADEKTEKMTGKKKMEKKSIVILDDLRAKLDLEQVGIPFGAGINGCKILFTSRFQYISYAAQKTITLGVLEEEETWRLFQEIVGDVTKDQDFFNIGKEVTKNCKGLPILTVTVAGALLQRRSLGAWKDALMNLRQEGSKEMQEFVDSALEFISFNHLPDVNKSLFLLCGLLGGGEISIFDQLLKLGIGRGLFKHTKTVEEARNNLATLIHDLKASFLLLDGQSVDSVRMHDVVRDVAIKIASNEGHNMLVGSSKEWSKDDMLNRCTTLTFPYGIVPDLSECLISPSLEFLLLYHNHSSLKITDNLFEKMQKLTVLDIRSVDLFPKLPSSLASLENLHTLSLNLCKLRDISIVGALKKLKILSLNSTNIVVLPTEIGDLSELRVLDLNGCSELKVIPPGIIRRLSQLEELHMAKSFSQWDDGGLASSERRNASLDELNYLVKLTTLSIHIPYAKLLPKDFCFEKLERFTILIGDENWYWSCHDDQSLYRFRGIKIKVSDGRDIHLEAMVQEMLKRIEILYLDGMKHIQELEWKRFQELKFVHIQQSVETRYIVDAMESFPAGLKSLFLSHLPQLQSLCRGTCGAGPSFNKLKYVDVNHCNSLRTLFPFSVARGLTNLERVKVTNCNALEAIVEDTREDDKNGNIVMHKLEFRLLSSLILRRLPKLASFCNNMTNSSIFPNRQKLVTTDEIDSKDGCTFVVPFFSEKILFPKLEELTLEACHVMEYLFDQSIVTGLEQLNFITIENCRSLKGVVAQVEGEETNEIIKFPQLVNLFLGGLPCLTRFCSACSIVFPALTRLRIRHCPQLKTFVWTDTIIRHGLQLKTFIWKNITGKDKRMANKKLNRAMQPLFNEKVFFPKLEKLTLVECDSMEYLFNQSVVIGLEQLNFIAIEHCKSLKGIVIHVEGEKTNETTIKFPRLTQLDVSYCLQLKTFVWGDAVREDNTTTNRKLNMAMQPLFPFFNEKVELLNLKKLQLVWLDNVETIWHNRLHEDSFFKLEQVDIRYCPNLLKIFPSTMLTRIQSLEELRLRNNCLVEEVFENDEMTRPNISQGGETSEDKIIFSQLRCLDLMHLSNLKRFCSGSCVVFPSLTELQIWYCEQIETIAVTNNNSTRKGVEDMDFNNIQPLFNDKVEFPSLKKLDLRNLAKVKIKWDSQMIHEGSFRTLEQLTIRRCAKLVRIFPLAMLERIRSLKKLCVMDSCCVEEIFEAPTNAHPNEIIDVMISDLYLDNLPKLKCVWREDLVQILCFRDLRKVDVLHCQALKCLFPSSVAQQMYRLEELCMSDCGVETIVCLKEEEVKGKAKAVAFVFPKLVTLYLENLPKLKWVWREDLVQILSFRDLRKVDVRHCQTLKYLFPAFVAQELHHLEELRISDCAVETIVRNKGEEVATFVFPKLVTLWLEGLPQLESFYPGRHTTEWPALKELVLAGMFCSDLLKATNDEGDSLLIPILESLKVIDCPGLTSIVQGLVSFKFLTELEVSGCHGLEQFSTARSLVQLTRLKVTACQTVKEIVASDSAYEAEDEIVFSKLKTLELVKLPSLVNFYLGDCILEFPLLEQVTVKWCSNMKAFCGGVTITPELKIVYLNNEKIDFERDEWREEDKDLNTIIKVVKTGILTEPVKKSEICDDIVKCSEEVANMNDKATNSYVEAESSEKAIHYNVDYSSLDDLNTIMEARRLTTANATSSSNSYSEPKPRICEITTEGSIEDEMSDKVEVAKVNDKVTQSLVGAETCEKVNQSKKNDGYYKKIVEPSKEVHTYNKAGNEGSQAPTPDIVDVTCPSSQSHPALGTGIVATTCPQGNEFEGLEVAQHLVTLLEKARDKHGDFHANTLIKSKTMRIAAMESVGQVLHILQTQPPRAIDAEKIQIMEDVLHDLSLMSFRIEWLRPLIDKARKCLFCLEKEAKIDEMEVQLQVLKRELETEKALIDLDRPLLDI